VVGAINPTGGSVDLTNNSTVVEYTGASPISSLRSSLAGGYASGAWNGTGINSSTAATFNATADPHKRALGYAEASAIGVSNFHGTAVDNSAVLIAYTLSGDANLDSVVNALDFNALATNYGPTSNLWSQGDFNYDGQVNSLDFDAIAANFNETLPTAAPAPLAGQALGSLVPEPTSLALLGLGASAILGRRRRSR
jgi:hypothetical protein